MKKHIKTFHNRKSINWAKRHWFQYSINFTETNFVLDMRPRSRKHFYPMSCGSSSLLWWLGRRFDFSDAFLTFPESGRWTRFPSFRKAITLGSPTNLRERQNERKLQHKSQHRRMLGILLGHNAVVIDGRSFKNKRPMGHIAHLRKQFKSINTHDYIITLIKRRKKKLTLW